MTVLAAKSTRLTRFFSFWLRLQTQLDALEGASRFRAAIILFLLVLPFYLYGALHHLETQNLDTSGSDQNAYLDYVTLLHNTGGAYVGDFNRMPVYLWLQKLHYDSDLSDEAYFLQAKRFNIALSVGLLVVIWVVYLRLLPMGTAFNLLLLTMFPVFVFRAAYFQAELLYYTLVFCLYIVMLRLIRSPSLLWSVVAGLIAGIAHLTKGAVLPALALFAVFFFLEGVYGRRMVRHVICLGIMGIFFLATVYPVLEMTHRVTGHYLYNVNTTFYIWYDDWDGDLVEGTRGHGDRLGWPRMDEDDLPSFDKFMERKSTLDIVTRLFDGLGRSIYIHAVSYGYFPYVVGLLLMVYVLTYQVIAHGFGALLAALGRRYVFFILFCGAYFMLFVLLYAFYVPINSGPRFMLALFMPLMFSFLWLVQKPVYQKVSLQLGGATVRWAALLNSLLLPVLVIHSLVIVFYSVSSIYAGN